MRGSGAKALFVQILVQICQKSRRIGCVIPYCNLQRDIKQPILRLFWHCSLDHRLFSSEVARPAGYRRVRLVPPDVDAVLHRGPVHGHASASASHFSSILILITLVCFCSEYSANRILRQVTYCDSFNIQFMFHSAVNCDSKLFKYCDRSLILRVLAFSISVALSNNHCFHNLITYFLSFWLNIFTEADSFAPVERLGRRLVGEGLVGVVGPVVL